MLRATLLMLILVSLSACKTAAPELAEPPPSRRDGDLDGLIDRLDGCPARAETYNDYRDWDGCPDPNPSRVIMQGTQLALQEQVQFSQGKGALLPVSTPLLEDIYRHLSQKPSLVIRIEGHTDSQGRPQMNKALSELRAQAVRSWLVAKGIDGNRIKAVGMGSEVPLATNDTEQGRMQNRRVEIHVESGL
ncbi:MAG: OmpA family protein [Myxococcota bacterium]